VRRALLIALVVLAACGGDDASPTVASESESSTTTTIAEGDVTVELTDLPSGYVASAEGATVELLSLGGPDPDRPAAQASARKTGVPEPGVTVVVFAGRADIVDSYRNSDTVEPSTMRDGTALVTRHEGKIVSVMWAEGGHAVFASGGGVPEDDLEQIVEGVRLRQTG
jgi:hypothetical protein